MVETEDNTYRVICQEGEFDETWYIDSDNDGNIDIDSDLGKKIIDVCTDYEVIDAIDGE
jgi:hypothetical protein